MPSPELDKLIAVEVEKFEHLWFNKFRGLDESTQVQAIADCISSSLRSFAEKLRAAVEVESEPIPLQSSDAVYHLARGFNAALEEVKANWDKLQNS